MDIATKTNSRHRLHSYLLLPVLFISATVNASNNGIPNYSQDETGSSSCHDCHSYSGSAPSNDVDISGSSSVLTGSINTYFVKLIAERSSSAVYGGFDLSASVGVLSPVDAETTIINNELVHSNRKATTDTGSSYDVEWSFEWQAPTVSGFSTLSTCALPVNGDGRATPSREHGTYDGRTACTTFDIQVLQKPTASAGNNQTVTEGDNVILDASASTDPDGSIVGYLWEQTGGTPATLLDANTASASFIAPDVPDNSTDELTFKLTVTDDDGLTASDTNSIFVQDALVSNLPPVADAGGDQFSDEKTTVTLNASGSSDDGTISSYLWQQTGGSNTVTLSDANAISPTFTAPSVDSSGDVLSFKLTVTDNLSVAATDTTTVTIIDVDTPPTAKVTDASGITVTAVNNNAQVTLYGNFSDDPDGPITAYSWSQTSGTAIIDPGVSNTNSFSFTAPDDKGSTIDIQLTVTGDEGSVQDSITATLTLDNLPPDVDAGADQTVLEGTTIELHGIITDPNNNLSKVQWQQVNCGSNCIMPAIDIPLPLKDGGAHTTILGPAVSPEQESLILEFELMAVDDGALSASSTALVTVRDNNINNFPDDAITFTSANGRPMAISLKTLEATNSAVITKLQPEYNSSINDDTNRPLSFPYELLELEIKLSQPGSVLVTLYFPEAVPEGYDAYQYLSGASWINTSKAKNFDDINYDATNGWRELTEEAEFSTDRRSVSFLLTDGGPSDQNPAALTISVNTSIGLNQPDNLEQPGATGMLSPFALTLFALIPLLLRLNRTGLKNPR